MSLYENNLFLLRNSQTSFLKSIFKGVATYEISSFEERNISMDYFLVSKHQTVEENILYSSKVLYQLLEKEKHIDELFLEYGTNRGIVLNLNVERVLYLALTFLFSIELIVINQNMIKRKPI